MTRAEEILVEIRDLGTAQLKCGDHNVSLNTALWVKICEYVTGKES